MIAIHWRSTGRACKAFCMFAYLFAAGQVVAYKNPVGELNNIGDPHVFRYDGPNFPKGYYMYPTSGTYEGYANVGFRCWYSTDLTDWQPKGWVLLEDPTTWAHGDFWGPEVHFKNGNFYMFYAATPSA